MKKLLLIRRLWSHLLHLYRQNPDLVMVSGQWIMSATASAVKDLLDHRARR